MRRLLYLLLVIYLLLLVAHLQRRRNAAQGRPPHVAAYLDTFREVAREVSAQTGVPPAIILAVAGLESAWGRSELSRQGNHFGIKARGEEPRYCLPTREFIRRKAHRVQACFRAYDDPEESFRDFGRLLSTAPHYQPLFRHARSDYQAWARGLSACGYATDPDYPEKLIRIIDLYQLGY